MKYIVTALLVSMLIGCTAVSDAPPEAYKLIAEQCENRDQVMRVYKTSAVLRIECVDG